MTTLTNHRKPQVVALLLTEQTRSAVLDDDTLDRLRDVADVRLPPADTPSESWDMFALLADAVVCITGWGTPRLEPELFERCPKLELVAHTAGSIRRLLPQELVGSRVRVCQSADIIARSVAEHTMAQILACLRQLHVMDNALHDGCDWTELNLTHSGRLLGAQTIGIVGASRTGRAVRRLLEPFGCRVLLSDPTVNDAGARELRVELVTLDSLLSRANVVSLHAPLLASTKRMLGRRELDLLCDGAVLVNNARGALVDEDALYEQLTSGRITAAIDVFDNEPLPRDSRWRGLRTAIISPHVAGQTRESHLQQGHAMVSDTIRFIREEELSYEVHKDVADFLA